MLLVEALTFVAALAIRASASEIAFPEGVHPTLYFSPDDVAAMRIKESTSHQKIAKAIREAARDFVADPQKYLPSKDHAVFSSTWNEHFGNNLCAFSMHCLLHPEDGKTFDLVMEYMDRMASYPNWYVAESPTDEVPVGHSLTGFATAYDFLYDRLDSERRQRYYNAIESTTAALYDILVTGHLGWTKQYIHNHAASNTLALLLGALVVNAHEPERAASWIEKAKQHLDFAMELFSYIVDGSVDEGVSYGSYTSRGMTQYVFLALRHLKTDHTQNVWLKEHFWFYFRTILPGYQRTVGIADANYNWFYGPESQIVFLDAFTMRNGLGNWLADAVRANRSRDTPLAPSTAQIWSSFHTEFLFYNSSIKSQNPVRDVKKMHIFSDWGVVTYGGGEPMKAGNTFMSFKSGVPNGEAMQEIMHSARYPERIAGWKSFNPGHEHPDQNSFVFAPNGRYVVSEALYGPKFTFLDNTIVFSPSSTSGCNSPWEGQIGECAKWLKYNQYTKGVRGDILTATESDNMVFIAGEARGVYSKSLKLSSVFRGVLLLSPEVLIVVDCIRLQPGSKTKKASAIFHNTWTKFENHTHQGHKGAKVRYPEGDYALFSMTPDGPINVTLHNGVQPAKLREGPTNYVNVTFSLETDITHIVHVFSGPNYEIKSASFQEMSKISGVSVAIDINGIQYKVNVATIVKSEKRVVFPVLERKRRTGFGGFAEVKVGSKSHHFGMDDLSFDEENGSPKRDYLVMDASTIEELNILPSDAVFTTSFDQASSRVVRRTSRTLKSIDVDMTRNFKGKIIPRTSNGLSASKTYYRRNEIGLDAAIMLSHTLFPVSALSAFWIWSLRAPRRRFTLRSWHGMSRVAAFLLACITAMNLICINSDGKNTRFGVAKETAPEWETAQQTAKRNPNESQATLVQKNSKVSTPSYPFVMMTSLPGSGGDLVAKLFENSDMSLYIPASRARIPLQGGDGAFPDFCLWSEAELESRVRTMGWFASLRAKPILHFNQEANHDETVSQVLRNDFNAPFAFNDDFGFWTTKLPWISDVVGQKDFQPVLVVRDPRSWINMLLRKSVDERRIEEQMVDAFEKIEKSCSKRGSSPPYYYRYVKMFQASRSLNGLSRVEKLAMIWTVSTGSVLANLADGRSSQWPLHVVRFEDILRDPEETAIDMFSKLGMPLGVRHLNKLIRVVKSGHHMVAHDGLVSERILSDWQRELTRTQIAAIENICCKLMTILRYDCA